MTAQPLPSRPKPPRLPWIDAARGVALLAMAVYHFSWDLEFFGYLPAGITAQGPLKIFARCIATSFLFLVGVSLVLAHGNGIRWQGFWKRFAMVAGAAALITVATFFAVRDEFIFFGILHQIAFASVAGLLFLRLPVPVTAGLGAAIIALPFVFQSSLLDAPWFWWLGISEIRPRSNDYVPVFPWFGVVLLGIAAANWAWEAGLFNRLAGRGVGRLKPLAFLGRHSLLFYLLHQPVLIGLVWCAAQVLPPQVETESVRFLRSCQTSCEEIRDTEFCTRYCTCMEEQVEQAQMMNDVFKRGGESDVQTRVQNLARMCTARVDLAEPAPQPFPEND